MPVPTHWMQVPDPFGPCVDFQAQGMAVAREGETVWVMRWYAQWYGGCGG